MACVLGWSTRRQQCIVVSQLTVRFSFTLSSITLSNSFCDFHSVSVTNTVSSTYLILLSLCQTLTNPGANSSFLNIASLLKFVKWDKVKYVCFELWLSFDTFWNSSLHLGVVPQPNSGHAESGTVWALEVSGFDNCQRFLATMSLYFTKCSPNKSLKSYSMLKGY